MVIKISLTNICHIRPSVTELQLHVTDMKYRFIDGSHAGQSTCLRDENHLFTVHKLPFCGA